MSIIARYSIFIRLSSEENTVFDFVTFRNWRLNPLIVLVVLSRKRHSTSNIIEGLNPQYRKVTKTKSVFPSDSALEKMLYLASGNVIPWLESGAESVDSVVWGATDFISIKGEGREQ